MENENQEVLTLDQLIKYNQEVLLPAFDERLSRFATKEDLNKFISREEFKLELKELKEDFTTKKEFNEFKDKSLTNQDKILKKLNTNSQEETMSSQKVDRHEKWFEKISQKLDIKLEY